MHSDSNQDGSARVRHVPIQIESRSGNDRQSPNQRQTRTNDRQNASETRYTNTPRDYSQTLPDTSSIDIRYKPSPPIRNQQPQSAETSANRQQQYESSPRFNNQHHQHQPQEERQADRERPDSSRSMSPNSDKLVNSPEPIPLPPPPQADESYMGTENASTNNNYSNTADEQNQQQAKHQQQNQKQLPVRREKDTSVMGVINSVRMDVMTLVQEITKFDGISGQSKEYRYLDEMLTRCVLNLDGIQCGDSSELRQHRKATVKLIDQASDILQRKLQINTDIHNLSENMAMSSSGSMNV